MLRSLNYVAVTTCRDLRRVTKGIDITKAFIPSSATYFRSIRKKIWGLKKTSFSDTIPFIFNNFLFPNTKTPSADIYDMSQRMKQRTAYDLDRINKIYRIE